MWNHRPHINSHDAIKQCHTLSSCLHVVLWSSVIFNLQPFLTWLPNLDRRVWILSFGRLLSQFGNGFTLFYAPIFFANQVGLSATAVGIGLGSGSVSGVIGRLLGGSAADSPTWGRRKTLLISAPPKLKLANIPNSPEFLDRCSTLSPVAVAFLIFSLTTNSKLLKLEE